MAGLKRFKYTDKDHAAIVADCISRIKEVYGAKLWNDFEEDNSGVMLVEAFAYIADLLLFYLDRQANETYLPTATERQNIINMCKLIGYTPYGAKSAKANIRFSIKEAHNSDISIPSGFQIFSQSGIIFETSDDAFIKAGDTFVDVQAEEGETFSDNIGISDGTTNQEFYLPRSGVVSVKNISINSEFWNCVDSFVEEDSDDKSYTAELDAWGRVKISFGDGINGRIPQAGENILAVYRIGGGINGNVAPDTLKIIRDSIHDINGNRVEVSAFNPDWASGGSDAQSIDSIKLLAPRFFETQKRCVTKNDYETFALNFGGIAKAHAVVHEHSGEANVIRLYVLTYGSAINTVAQPTDALKQSLLEYLNEYKMLTDWLDIQNGTSRNINFSGNVKIKEGYISENVIAGIQDALNSLMNIEFRSLGQELRISDVYSAIDNVAGVDFVELSEPVKTLTAGDNELLTLGNINFSVS